MANYLVLSIADTSAGISLTFTKENDSESKFNVLVPSKYWKEHKCNVGDTVSSEEYEAYNRIAVVTMAISRTVKILSYSDHSKLQLIKKLSTYGFDKEIALEAVKYAEKHGYINENAQAERAAAYYLKNKYWGKKRIAADLLFKGYSKEAVMHATNAISEEDYVATLKKLLRRKYPVLPTTKEEVMAMYSSFGRLGYSISEIQTAEKELLKDE